MPELPCLVSISSGQQLHVHGKPFLMRAAELQNSSMSSARYMKDIWPKLKAANTSTVLGAVPWDLIEPVEGHFSFTELDQIILDARSHGLHLILLWFGSFKNGLSTYAPSWVKTIPTRFPRVRLRRESGHSRTADVLSLFDTEACAADAKAFCELMQHLRQVDEDHSTVIMVQVENEVGILGDSRDRSLAAQKVFDAAVPEELKRFLSSQDNLHDSLKANLSSIDLSSATGAWTSTFGDTPQTDELFMAYHYAKYVEQVAAAGRRAYPLPLYTNVWQNYASPSDSANPFPTVVGGGGYPGDYPSGGGVINVLDIWRKFAPSLSMISPDIYLNDYEATCAKYRHNGQALFIPEQRRDEYGARRIWAALGTHQAIGMAPFGIDTLTADENPFRKHYGLVEKMQARILKAQRKPGTSIGFFFDEPTKAEKADRPSKTVIFGQWKLKISRAFVFGEQGPGFGMVIHEGGAKFFLVGEGFQVKFEHADDKDAFTGILSFEELEVDDPETGEMTVLRTLGGDETRSGEVVVMPATSPDYGDFPISVTIPAHTRIARCEVYSLEGQ